MAAPENFDRLQLCSFSQRQMFYPRGYARVYEAARMYIPPFYGYFTACGNLYLRALVLLVRLRSRGKN